MERKNISKILHSTLGRGISEIREKLAQSKFSEIQSGEYFLSQRPTYFSQLANADNHLIDGFYGEISDKKASRRFGAPDLETFSYWAWRSCGIVGVQMILKTVFDNRFTSTTMDLVEEGLKLNGYNISKDEGWYHRSLVELARRHGLLAETKKFIPSTEIALLIAQDKFVLASIKSNTGGHLLLIYGFKIGKNKEIDGFWVHDPNSYLQNGESMFITKQKFDKLSTRRAIIFERKIENG